MSVLSTVIDEEGCVRDTLICEGESEGFDEAAREALSRWVFEPATTLLLWMKIPARPRP